MHKGPGSILWLYNLVSLILKISCMTPLLRSEKEKHVPAFHFIAFWSAASKKNKNLSNN